MVEAAGSHWSGEPNHEAGGLPPDPGRTARINELKSGGIDIITNVPPLLIGSLQNPAGIEIVAGNQLGSIILIPSFLNTDVFKKKEVRQALKYAIDKDELIKVVLRGEAVPMSSPFPKGVAGGFVERLQPYPYDPEKAKSLLEAGRLPDGFTVSFKAPNGRYLQDKQVAEAIAGQLEKVGIKAELETVEWSTYVQGIVGRKYELFLLSQGGCRSGPAVQTNWSSKIKGIAWQGYDEPKVDELIDTRRARQVDGAARRGVLRGDVEDGLGRSPVDLPVPPAGHLWRRRQASRASARPPRARRLARRDRGQRIAHAPAPADQLQGHSRRRPPAARGRLPS